MTDTASAAPSDVDIDATWGALPGIRIHNDANARGLDTQTMMRRAFARAVLAKWGTLRAEKIVIPADTMEQEFQKHYRRGYEAGKKAATPQPTQAQAGAVPLTDEQIVGVMHSIPINAAPSYHIAFARAIEAGHGIQGGHHDIE